MPKRWPMTIQHRQPLTLWTGTDFCPFPIWSLVDRTTAWSSPKRPWPYTKALQYWVEKAQALPPGDPCLTGGEHAGALASHGTSNHNSPTAEVLDDAPPFNWVKITSSRMLEPMDLAVPWEWSCSRNHMASSQGIVHGGLWHKVVKTHSLSTQVASPSASPQYWKVRFTGKRRQVSWLCKHLHQGSQKSCEIPPWGWLTLCSYGHHSGISQGTGPHMGSSGPQCSLPGYSKIQLQAPCVFTWWPVQWA